MSLRGPVDDDCPLCEPGGGLLALAGTSGAGRFNWVIEAEESFLCIGGILKKEDLEFPPILEEEA